MNRRYINPHYYLFIKVKPNSTATIIVEIGMMKVKPNSKATIIAELCMMKVKPNS